MADFGIDTSSYPKPALPVSPLDTVGKIQSLQSGALTIDQQKLDLYNKHFAIMNNELSNLANDPATTKEEVLTRLHRIGDTFSMPKEVRDQMEAEFAPVPGGTPLGKDGSGNPALSRQLDLVIKRGMDMQQRINSAYGVNGSVNNNQSITPSKQYLRGGPIPAGPSIQIQNPPSTPGVYGDDGTPRFLGSVPPQIPAGSLPVQGGFPGQYQPSNTAAPSLPVAPAPTVIKPAMGAVATPPATAKDDTRLPALPPTAPVPGQQPTGPASGMPANWEEGRQQRIKDQAEAADRSAALKPALYALHLMKDIKSGPTSGKWNEVVAGLKYWGIVPTETNGNDKTAIYQEVNKYLHQYLGQTPFRSDAEQSLRSQGSPDLGTQIHPALEKLTRNAIILDQLRIARGTGAFSNVVRDATGKVALDESGNPRYENRNDNHNYNEWRARFPQSIDERAFNLTLPENKDGDNKQLLDNMYKKAKSDNAKDRIEGEKFFRTLDIIKRLNLYNME
jgi:hypothetical protein